jgi:uncharacterized protein YjiK
VDLSQYSLVGRYDLPEPTRTTAPTNSLLTQEASSVTYDWDTDSLFVVGDGGTSVVQVSKTGQLIDSMTLAPGDSPQGTTFYDTEAITYVGGGKFVLGEERYRQANLFTYVAGGTLTRADVQTVKLGTTIGNIGMEGITYDPQTSTGNTPGFIAVKEQDPEGIFQTNIDFPNGTATNGSPTTDEPTNLFDPSLAGTEDLSDVYALSNLPSITGAASSNLIFISQQSDRIVEVDRTGAIQSSLTIADPTSSISVPDETHEGVTMDRNGYLYTVSEDGGGDQAHPQMWVYAPPSVQPTLPRMTISEVAPWGSSASYGADWFELTNDSPAAVDLTGWKMDDNSNTSANAVPLAGVTSLPAGKSAVFFEDTGLDDATVEAKFAQAWYGTSTLPANLLVGHYGGTGVGLSSSGDAVNIFDASGNRVTGLAFGASPSTAPLATFDNREGLSSSGTLTPPTVTGLSVAGVNGAALAADGAEIGSPGGVTSATPPPPPPTSVIVSEVAPWGSGNAPYAVDWFEVTNKGTSAVDLTGWKMDDNSNSFANAVVLAGVSSLAAGQSAVFFEDTGGLNDATVTAAFAQAWFGTSTLPTGFLIGHYGGSGVGLSTGGDQVNLFDASGSPVTGVAFGASPSSAPFATFDNTAGLGSTTLPPTITTMSAVGTNGAFLAADGVEIGSPGTIGTVTPPPAPSVIVSEVAPWGSGNAPYAVDWFELTNKGTSAVDLTGWKMDDNSNSFANAVALAGVSSLPAGQSAVFFEDTGGLNDATVTAAFAQAWFGTSTLPAGFLIGHYGGSGIGLSTSGDAVNLFNAAGSLVTGVAFGASASSAPFATFDNTAGLGSTTLPLPTISTLSVAGTNGAFLATDGAEIGSPAGAAPPADNTPATVVGSVVDDATSAGIAGICAYAYPVGSNGPAANASCTQADGSYELDGVAPGQYNIALSDPTGVYPSVWIAAGPSGQSTDRASASVVAVTGGGSVTVPAARLAPVTNGKVTGTVTDAVSAGPIGNICVYLYPHGNSAAASYATCTNADGTYVIPAVATGSYDVAFFDPASAKSTQWYTGTTGGAATQAGAQPITVAGGNKTVGPIDAALAASPIGNVAGVVIDAATGQPVAGVCVYLYQVGRSDAASYATCTAADGRWAIFGADSGSYDVVFADPGAAYTNQWYTGSAGGSADQSAAVAVAVPTGDSTVANINAALAPVTVGTVTGKVTAADTGGALANVCVYAYPHGTSGAAAYASCTAADGTYQLAGVAAGRYDLAFFDPTGQYVTGWSGGASSQASAQVITVTGAKTSSANAALTLVQVGTVAGAVTNGAGTPVANICVYIYPHGTSAAAAYATCTDATGQYQLSGVAQGLYDVAFFDPTATYATQWYNSVPGGAPTQASAKVLSVVGGNHVTSGLNAVLAHG